MPDTINFTVNETVDNVEITVINEVVEVNVIRQSCANILNHLSNTSNPHNTTAAQVGAPSGSGTSTGSNTGDETTTTILNKIGDGSKISSSYLPAYVDDVLEFANFAALPVTGEQGIIYVTEDTNYSYRWSGSAYISLSNPLDYASQIEAEGNSENTKLMTSLRVFQNWFNNVSNYVLTALNTSSKTIIGAINELFSNKLDKLSVSYNSNITKTLDLNDVNRRIVFVNTNTKTLTIPTNLVDPIPVGSKIEITQYSTGSINLSYDIAVTVVSNIGFSTQLNGTYILTKTDVDTWTFEGFIYEGVRQPYTVYIDTTGAIGSDLTGMIENKLRPFQTFAAALSQIDNNNLWEFIFIDDGNINRTISGDMSNKKIKITCYNTGNSSFTFTGTSSVNQAIYLEIYTPNVDVIIAGTSYSVGASTLILNCKDLSFSGTNGAQGKLFSSNTVGFYSNVTCNAITVTAAQVYPLWLARLTLNVNILNITSTTLMGGSGGIQQIYEFYAKTIVVSGNCILFASHIYINCITQNVSGTGSLYILRTNSNTLDLMFMQGNIATTVNVYLIDNVNGTTLASCNVKVSGVYSDKYVTNPLLISRRVGGVQGTTCLITLKNFTGAISTDIIDSYNVTFINSNIFVNTFLATIPAGGYNILGMRFLGTNVIHQQTPGALINKTNTPLIADVLQNFGEIKTNATSLGTNVTINNNTPNTY